VERAKRRAKALRAAERAGMQVRISVIDTRDFD